MFSFLLLFAHFVFLFFQFCSATQIEISQKLKLSLYLINICAIFLYKSVIVLHSSIGRRNGDTFCQLSECFVSETQEMVAVSAITIQFVAFPMKISSFFVFVSTIFYLSFLSLSLKQTTKIQFTKNRNWPQNK